MKHWFAVIVLFFLTCAASTSAFSQFNQRGGLSGVTPFSKQDSVKPVAAQKPAVTFGNVEAFTDGNGVFVKWHTQTEFENIGFYLFRTEKGVTERVGDFVRGSYLLYGKEPTTDEQYSVFDPKGDGDSVYSVQAFLLTGPRVSSQTVSVKFTSNLNGIAGGSGKSLSQNALATNGILTSNSPTYSKTLQSAIDNNRLLPNITNQRFVAA